MFIFSIYSVLQLFSLLLIILLLSLVLLRAPKFSTKIAFGFYGLSLSLWLAGMSLLYASTTKEIAIPINRIAYSGVIMIPITAYYFTTIFIPVRKIDKTIVNFLYVIGFALVFICNYTDLIINDVYKYFWGFYPKGNAIQLTNFILFTAISLRTVFISFRSLFEKDKTGIFEYNRRKYVFFALLLSLLGFFDFLPCFGLEWYPPAHILVVIFFSILVYAIVRHHLLDIEVIIRRAVVFTGMFTAVFGIFVAITVYGQQLLADIFGINNRWIMATLAVLFITVLYEPLRNFFINITDRFLLQKKYDYQKILKEASVGMAQITDLRKLLSLIIHVLSSKLRTTQTGILLYDKEINAYKLELSRGKIKIESTLVLEVDNYLLMHLNQNREPLSLDDINYKLQDKRLLQSNSELKKQFETIKDKMQELKAYLCVPAFVKEKLLGVLVLGEKLSRDLYSSTDLALLSTLANQAALAIENAQFYEDIKKTQEQLFQAEKMATIGTMADGLSHQVNNRFQALSLIAGDSMDILQTTDISNCSQEIKETCDQMKHAFERIQANVMQGGEIVRGLLRYSRPTQEGFQYEDFNHVLNGALEMAQYKVRLQELDIQKEIPQDLPKLKCNLVQLQEVFFNLLDNAYDAIKERKMLNKDLELKGRIKIAVSPINNHLHIVFEDNGIGVRDKDKEKLFTPFFTTKSSTRKGTGLGLYVIQKIINFHEGTISIDSTYNSGTKFEITLPVAK